MGTRSEKIWENYGRIWDFSCNSEEFLHDGYGFDHDFDGISSGIKQQNSDLYGSQMLIGTEI